MNIMWIPLQGLLHMPRPASSLFLNISPSPRPNRVLCHLAGSAAAFLGYSMGSRVGVEGTLDFRGRVRRAVLGGRGGGGARGRGGEIARAFRSGEPTAVPIGRTFGRFGSPRTTSG